MQKNQEPDGFSRLFLMAWVGLPGLSFFLSLFVFPQFGTLNTTATVCFFVAAIFYPLELNRRGAKGAIRVLTLCFLISPYLLAADRLEYAQGFGLAQWLLIGIWLGFVDSFWGWAKLKGVNGLPVYFTAFFFVGFGFPLFGYLIRNFTEKPDFISQFSPFILIQNMTLGSEFTPGAVFVASLFALFLIQFRRLDAKINAGGWYW